MNTPNHIINSDDRKLILKVPRRGSRTGATDTITSVNFDKQHKLQDIARDMLDLKIRVFINIMICFYQGKKQI